jgi:hypothetical protein
MLRGHALLALVIAGGMEGDGTITDQSYTSALHADGTLGAWQPAGSTQHARMHGGEVVNGDTVYVLGGFDGATVWDDVVRATAGANGALSAWTSAGKLPGPRSHVYSVAGAIDFNLDSTDEIDVGSFE